MTVWQSKVLALLVLFHQVDDIKFAWDTDCFIKKRNIFLDFTLIIILYTRTAAQDVGQTVQYLCIWIIQIWEYSEFRAIPF